MRNEECTETMCIPLVWLPTFKHHHMNPHMYRITLWEHHNTEKNDGGIETKKSTDVKKKMKWTRQENVEEQASHKNNRAFSS